MLNLKPHTFLAFDYGTRKIGVAVGQTVTGTATPLPELRARDGAPDWDALERLLREWKPRACVVGLPLNMDGTESDMSRRARRFANRLHGRYALPVHLMDERLSSREAREIGRHDAARAGRNADERRPVDSLAAQVILESWLAEQETKGGGERRAEEKEEDAGRAS